MLPRLQHEPHEPPFSGADPDRDDSQTNLPLHGAQVDSYARVADSIVGWGSKLGPWSRLENHAVVGEDVTVRPEVNPFLTVSTGRRSTECCAKELPGSL